MRHTWGMVKHVAILGSTGSIGTNALRVVDALNGREEREVEYRVVAISGHSNIRLLAEQAKRYKPAVVAVTDGGKEGELARLLEGVDIEILSGSQALEEIAGMGEVDLLLTAVVGAAGLGAVLAAAKGGKTLAIANKEPLVVAGEMLMEEVRKSGGKVVPVDSEHSAVFQAMQAGKREEVRRIVLTSSGGPFREWTKEEMAGATIEDALAHPVWDMGRKITVDSATMMNKALEVIEARWLFGVEVEKIEVLVHPESIVHGMVEFADGSVVAQMGRPDMCLPIQYALTWPGRVAGVAERLRLEEIGKLTFERPDVEKFRALKLGFEVARAGGTAGAVFNAANEAAVEAFLGGRIRFGEIVELVERCLNRHNVKQEAGLEGLMAADSWARKEVGEMIGRRRQESGGRQESGDRSQETGEEGNTECRMMK